MAGRQIDWRKFTRFFVTFLLIVLEAVAAVILMYHIFLKGIKLVYYSFYHDTVKEFMLPEFASEFVPQGLDYIEEEDVYLISGYIYKNKESRIFVIKPDGTYHMLKVLGRTGNPLRSHSGGICESGEYIYMAGGNSQCYVFRKEDVLCEDNDTVKMAGNFPTYNSASFCCAEDGFLYVGEYYYRFKYTTREEHHLITPYGDKNNATVSVFAVNDKEKYGVSEMPEKILSIPGRAQGMCLTDDGELIMSASSIFEGSQLYYYDYKEVLNATPDYIMVKEEKIPLLYLDRRFLVKEQEILPKAEELTFVDGRIYMLFESACSRFQYGKWLDGQYVYSMDVTKE